MREGERVREGERGEGGKERERERESSETYTHVHASAFTHTYNKQTSHAHTYCVPIIMHCTPTLSEISVTTRADKVFLMPAQVLSSDTWLQRVGTKRKNHTVSINWNIRNNNFM